MAASVTLMTANGCFFKKKIIRLFRRLKWQVLVSEVNFVKKRSLLFEIDRYLFASHEVNMPCLT